MITSKTEGNCCHVIVLREEDLRPLLESVELVKGPLRGAKNNVG